MSRRVGIRMFEAWLSILLVTLSPLYLSSSARASYTACPQNIPCDNGYCREEALNHWQCECEGDFSGPSCDIPFETCADGVRKCYNGSKCKRNNAPNPDGSGTYGYHCDCSEAYAVNSFAGHECEHSATETCEHGVAASEYSFCTNGGECMHTILPGGIHPGCHCPEEFEGLHCQYLAGTAPEDEKFPNTPPKNKEEENGGGGLGGVAIFFIVLVCVAVVGGMGFVIYRKKKQNEGRDHEVELASSEPQEQAPGSTHSLGLGEDGEEGEII